MIKEIKLEDIDPIGAIEAKIWFSVVVMQDAGLNAQEIFVILYLIILYRDGYLTDLRGVEARQIINEFSQQNIRNEIKNDTAVKDLLYEFSPILEKLGGALESIIINLKTIDKEELSANFSDVFESIFYRLVKDSGRTTGEYILPYELGRFLSGLVSIQSDGAIYNPFAGMASFGVLSNPESRYFGQEINRFTYTIGVLRLIANMRYAEAIYSFGDSILNWNPRNEKYDLIIANPPFRLKLTEESKSHIAPFDSLEHFLISKSLEDIRSDGKIVLLLPLSFLYNTNKDKELRKSLIQKDLVDKVIALPSGSLSNTNISTCVLVIDKRKKKPGKVCIIDATRHFKDVGHGDAKKLNDYALNSSIHNAKEKDFITFVENSDIKSQDYSLHVPLYFQKNYNGIPIKKFTEVIAGKKQNKITQGHFVRIRDLKEDLFNYTLSAEDIAVTNIPKYSKKINESCLLLSIRWKSLKPTFFEFTGEPIYIAPDIVALRFDKNQVDLEYLIASLIKDLATEQLNSFRYGVVAPTIRVSDLIRVKIPIPSIDDQKEEVSKSKQKYIKDKIEENRAFITALQKEMNDSIRIKKHNIMQHLNNVKSAANLLYDYMEENGGVLKSDEILNPTKGITVKKRFSRMLESLQEAMIFVDRITEEIVFGEGEYLILEKILN
jgi:type I restriction enzyme M protein